MTATAHATIDATTASSGRLSSVASGALEFVWPMYLTLVLTLGAWVVVPTVLFGWQPVTIISGSMAPAIEPGHVVVVEPFSGQRLGPGTVVTFRDATQDRLVTHRVAAVEDDGTLTTRGDANTVDDAVPLTTDRIVGVGRLVVPAAGLPALWAHQGRTDLLAIVAVLTMLATTSAVTAASHGASSVRLRRSIRRGMWRQSRTRTAVVGTGAAVLIALLAVTGVSRAAFVGARANTGNGFTAAALSTPTGLSATPRCVLLGLLGPHVALSWTGSPGNPGYEVLRSTSSGGTYSSIGTTTGTTFNDTAVVLFSTYHYRVRAVAGAWVSPVGTTAQATMPLLC